jgi:hypothetical protein
MDFRVPGKAFSHPVISPFESIDLDGQLIIMVAIVFLCNGFRLKARR